MPIRIARSDPSSPEARRCLHAYAAELDRRFPEGFAEADLVPADDVRERGVCLLAYARGRAVGCAVLRDLTTASPEIKHLWVAPEDRGHGIASRLLASVEQIAREQGCRSIRLDTHSHLTEAIALYRSSGYRQIPPYGVNRHAHLWFEKRLAATAEG